MLRKAATGFVQKLYQLSSLGLKKKYPFTRYAMYKSLEKVSGQLPKTGRVLSISHSAHLCEILGIKPTEVVDANFPDVNILNLPHPDASFDFVFSDQVFEHIEGNPQAAIDETMRVLKPGGFLIHTTCMFTPIHGPGDFWRFTPEGLAYLCRKASRVIEAGGWGHTLVPVFTMLGFTWANVPEARWHPVNYFATLKRSSYPHVVWVVAQK